MTTTLLQFDFPFEGPWGGTMSEALDGLARDISGEKGLVWKIWTENEAERRAGGIYLFSDAASAEAYRRKHEARLGQFGITGIVARTFSVNAPLTAITRGPV